jgi:hypothetical protein
LNLPADGILIDGRRAELVEAAMRWMELRRH